MRRYDILAEALARALGKSDEQAGAAMRASGRSLGHGLARPHVASMSAALEPLVEMGAAYELGRAGRIDCTNCLFAEVCRRVPSICEFHAGVIEALSDREDERSRIEPLGFQGPSGCAFMEVD